MNQTISECYVSQKKFTSSLRSLSSLLYITAFIRFQLKTQILYCSSLVFALKRIRTGRLRKVNIRRNWINSFAKYLLKFYEISTRDHRKLLNRWIAFTIPRFFHKQTAGNALKPFRGEAAESFPTKILRWWTKL